MTQEYFAYSSVLEALSSGLYPDKRHVIREFIQNAFDAANDWKKLSKESSLPIVEVRIQKPSIIIADKGIGMDRDQANKFRYLGYSSKDRKENVGFRGIGKDSGLAVAEKIIMTTSRFGNPFRYTVVIDAHKMLDDTLNIQNTPLEKILASNTWLKEEPEEPNLHYTFIELHNIRKDASTLSDTDKLKDYIRRTCPVPLSPEFGYTEEITNQLRKYVPTFSETEIKLEGENLYKPFPTGYSRPEYESSFLNESIDAPLVAFCWYCGNKNKGRFVEKDDSGLVFRVKNFAVGDRHLTRKSLWMSTPERAFHFFGEIHILDEKVVPSSDRTDFEDNDARNNLFLRSQRIAKVLNQTAGTESDQRNFNISILSAQKQLAFREQKLELKEIPVEVKPLVEYQLRKTIEDLEKRVQRTSHKKEPSTKEKELIQRGSVVLKNAKVLLKIVEKKQSFFDINKKTELTDQSKQVYRVIVDYLIEEFSSEPEKLEKIIYNINARLAKLQDN